MYFGNVEIVKHENGRISFTVRSDVSPSEYLHNVDVSIAHHFIANLRDLGHITDTQQAEAETFIRVHNVSQKELVLMELRRLTVLANLIAADFNDNDDAFERTAIMCKDIEAGFCDLADAIHEAKPAEAEDVFAARKEETRPKKRKAVVEDPQPADCECGECSECTERETTFTAGRRG